MTKTHLTKTGSILPLGRGAVDFNNALCGARQGAGRQGLLFTTDATDSNLCARCANTSKPADAKKVADRAAKKAKEDARNEAEIARWRAIREAREAAEAAAL